MKAMTLKMTTVTIKHYRTDDLNGVVIATSVSLSSRLITSICVAKPSVSPHGANAPAKLRGYWTKIH